MFALNFILSIILYSAPLAQPREGPTEIDEFLKHSSPPMIDTKAFDTQVYDHITKKQFDTWLIYFYVPWCSHCRDQAPIMREVFQ